MAYAFTTFDPKRMARASVRDASVSFKKSVELSKRLRGMMSDKAERYLGEVIELKSAVPFTRYTNGAGHRRGPMMAGKYPVKAAQQFLTLIKQGVANAENAGLGTPLKIVHVLAQPAASPRHAGRKRGLTMKRAHLELVLAETEESKRHEKKQKRTERAEKRAAEKAAEKAAEATGKAVAQKPVTPIPITQKPITQTTVAEQKTDEKRTDERKADIKSDVPETAETVKKDIKRPAAKKAPAEKREPKAKPAKKSDDHTE